MRDEITQLRETALAIAMKANKLPPPDLCKTVHNPTRKGSPMEAISDLPMIHDMDVDYSPQYVKLARILREKIKGGDLKRPAPLPAPWLASEYGVSVRVAHAALAMLAANRYVSQAGNSGPYRVTWQDALPDHDDDK